MSRPHAVGAEARDPAPRGTRVACIIGWPVEHSLSPAMHNEAFRSAGLNWTYVPLPVAPPDLAAAVAGIRALGIAGANVTMPHKQTVIAYLDEVSREAERIGAVNVVVRAGDRLLGANTDGTGFLRFLERGAGVQAAGTRILILGSGGAARALAATLGDAGSEVVVAARNAAAAAETAALAGALGRTEPFAGAAAAAENASVIVNATPLGSGGEDLPISVTAITPDHVVVDLIYAPPVTALIAAARERGARAYNGFGMLVEQAALSFELWTGRPAPREAMAAAALREIATEKEPGPDPA